MVNLKPDNTTHALVDREDMPGNGTGRTTSGKSWRAPAIILSTLLIGLGIALAHHFMNVSLDNVSIKDVRVSQAWISRFSTALAFLTKLSFTTSIGASFVQHQWLRFHQQSFKVREVDAVTSVLTDLLSLFSSLVWFRHPILVLTALASWIIPFAAVVTPGSLSVLPMRTTTPMMLQVPQPLYDLTNYGYVSAGGSYVVTIDERVLKLAYATASTAQPVSLQPTHPNETYHLQFNGPAVKCGPANDSFIHNISSLYGGYSAGNKILYKSWVPGSEGDHRGPKTETLDYNSRDGARLFVMTNLVDTNVYVNQTTGATLVNVTECVLYNATYDVDFTFQSFKQTHQMNISHWLNPVFSPVYGLDREFLGGLGGRSNAIFSYCTMMSAFGKLLVGQEDRSHYNIDSNLYTSRRVLHVNWNHSETVETGLEQLFQNFTLSLLSDEGLRCVSPPEDRFFLKYLTKNHNRKNASLADSVPVTVETWPVIYVYDRSDLFLAYGLSFLAVCICAVIGLHAFFVNHGSYQNVFSTFLRTTNDAQMRNLIEQEDNGADPLPKYLAQATVNVMARKETAYVAWELQRAVD
ncbi:hypothetical protein DM02DRAFT_693815 [Periconia macrospinosa]|uniref:Uncharacterized protein n=1 Tax=Periconia macrospinosa TaxID=97972 RepID=A0A2V1DAF5_9PLEO|nr:hypothetical protein DM02DRAFT_693815 [Periconia macrospinosa]